VIKHVRQKLLETGGVLTLNSYRPLQKLQGPPENEIKWDIPFTYGANNVVCEVMDLIIIIGVQEVRTWKRLRPMVLFCLTHCKVIVQILNSFLDQRFDRFNLKWRRFQRMRGLLTMRHSNIRFVDVTAGLNGYSPLFFFFETGFFGSNFGLVVLERLVDRRDFLLPLLEIYWYRKNAK